MTLDEQDLDAIAARIESITAKLATSSTPAPRLMNIAAAAVYMGRTVSSVTHLVRRGALPVTRLDGKIQIDRVALDKLIATLTEKVA